MNVPDRLERRLAGGRLSALRELSRLAARDGIHLYLVGGTVRDVLANDPPADVDVMASSGADRLVESIIARGDSTVRKASAFGTWSLTVRGVDLDISTARREIYERPGALPTVFPGTVIEDLARRDFSINAMAVSLIEDSWGRLLDPHGGACDLERGLIRVLHQRSFEDDATRILRAVRYACRRDFRLEARTRELLECGLPFLDAITPDRVRHEVERIFREPRAAAMLEMAGRLGVLAAIHPTLRADPVALRQIEAEPADHARKAGLLLGSMAQSVPASEVESVIERLNMNADWTRIVRDVAAVRERQPQLENAARSRVYRLLRGRHPAAVRSCAMAATDPAVAAPLRLYLDELRHVRPLLNGDDLMALGVPEGPPVGRLLGELLDARLDGLVESAKDEEDLARRVLRRE